ncbi:MAG: OmpA family protein [Deltaproteobacteria bacterium]|nr:OmpA family protein [Deltaproteobacteria bacterium]
MEKIKLSIFITVILSLMVFLGFLTGCCCKQVAGVPDAIELRVEFDTNKSFVRPAYHERIKEVADYMNKHSDVDAVIEGHTDSRGSDQYNQSLSQRRADSVRQYLIDKFGISASRLTAKGYGESKPIADNNTAQGRQRNRRVIAVFLK